MDQIAEATRSSKATLYRQWGSKGALLVDALHCSAALTQPAPDTGSLRGDLHEMVRRRARVLDHQADLVGSILQAVKSDPSLRDAVREQVVTTLHARLQVVVDRAVDRGEVAADSPGLPYVDLVVMAPFVLKLLLGDVTAEDASLEDYLDAVLLPALGVPVP